MTQVPDNPYGEVGGTTSTGTGYGPTSSETQYGVATGTDYDPLTGRDVAGVDPSISPAVAPDHNGGPGVTDTVKTEAASVAQDAKDRGKDVAGTAAEEAKDVAREVKSQIMQLLDQLRGEATTQASDQSRRAAQGLHSLGSELSQMASSGASDGVASDLVRQAAERVRGAANWLDGREPGELLDDVRDFARRRPGTFLAGAALLGVIGGRMTRGLAAGSSSGGAPASSGSEAYLGTTDVYTTPATPGAYGNGSGQGPGVSGAMESDLSAGLVAPGTSATGATSGPAFTDPENGTREGWR